MSRKNNHLIFLLLPLLAAGCKQMSVPTLGLGAHKIDIQQGNVVTQDMLAKLQPGMTRSQVRFVLGTPLLVDPFRTDRWDYVYTMNQKGERVEQRQLKVYFQDDKMLRYEGDVLAEARQPGAANVPAANPTEKPVAAPVVVPPAVEKPAEKTVAAKPEQKPADKPAERGFFGRLFGGAGGAGGAAGTPAPRASLPNEREAQPGLPPAPFVDPDPAAKKP